MSLTSYPGLCLIIPHKCGCIIFILFVSELPITNGHAVNTEVPPKHTNDTRSLPSATQFQLTFRKQFSFSSSDLVVLSK